VCGQPHGKIIDVIILLGGMLLVDWCCICKYICKTVGHLLLHYANWENMGFIYLYFGGVLSDARRSGGGAIWLE